MSNENLHTSAVGLKLIKESEGYVGSVYLCPAGKPTIGYGHVVEAGEKFGHLSEPDAVTLLAKDLQRFETALHKANFPALNQNQFDAFVSWAYNCGPGVFADSTAARECKAGNHAKVPAGIAMWDKATVDGKLTALPGLTKRRKAEGDLYAKPV